MGKTLIRIACIDQQLVVVAAPRIASGGLNEDMVEFEFCPLWDGFEKVAVFYRDEETAYHATVTDDRCLIPHEVLMEEGLIHFGVFGVKDNTTRTSEIVEYRVVEGILTEGTQPSDPTPDIYAQLLAKMAEAMSHIDQYEERLTDVSTQMGATKETVAQQGERLIVLDEQVDAIGTQLNETAEGVNQLKDKFDTQALMNVHAFGVLPGADCSEALQAALAASRRLYFPAGEYTFSDILVTQDAVLVLAPGAHFHAENTRMLTAYNCSLSIYGGTISCGADYPDRHNTPYGDPSRKMIYRSNSHNEGVIELYGCHDCVFEGIDVPYCSASSAIMVYGDSRGKGGDRPVSINGVNVVPDACRNIRFNNCRFNNTLLSAIHVLYHCKNIVTDGCTFTNALRGTYKDGTLIPYAYTIYTGVKSVGVNGDMYLYFTPTDGYVFRNCYVENCEGTGVDTHAASNVLYENNTFIDCDSFITAYHDYRRVYTADGWVMENVIVRNNRCINRKAFDYQGNEYPHQPFMLHNMGPEGTMRNIVVENNLIDTNWYRLSGSSPSEMVCLYSTDGIILRNNTIISRAETAVGYYIARCNGVLIENQTFEGAFNYGFHFVTSVIRMGAVFCMGATFNNAVMRINRAENQDGSISPYCCFVDTDNMVIDNPAVTETSGWEYSLNRYGRPLQSAGSTLPLDGNVIADVKGYYGKDKVRWLQTITAIDGNRVTVGNNCRAIPGMRIAIGDDTYYVMGVESYWESPDATAKTYVYVLDNDVADASMVYIYLTAPCSDRYSRPNSDEFSQTWGEIGESTDFNDYTTPGVYRTNNRAFTNGPYAAASYARLEVSYSVVQAQLIQRLYVGGDNENFGLYIRFKRSSSWSPWYKMDMTKVVTE